MCSWDRGTDLTRNFWSEVEKKVFSYRVVSLEEPTQSLLEWKGQAYRSREPHVTHLVQHIFRLANLVRRERRDIVTLLQLPVCLTQVLEERGAVLVEW